ncbi:mannitol dehydrogenase family protein [Hoeflea sp. YIM 152468]|uniref:mannitol dehydrogenase family protein n=1 Tax=Hoeflea sp. YIM 152468 TaxID=3031759 RepID=UPI0023DAD646|nr:mannitol dehydrogenase family protein [Hoeflea sp. YIM 152468]MDF1608875.1 mannitol dehydrogenase family protein [Hoeflea sp. YIM 152468]
MTAAPKRLASLDQISGEARLPGYDPARHGCAIVHLGAGAFHRAHQAVYTDDALTAEGGDWRITGVSLRGTDTADAMQPQNGLYTLIERGAAGSRGRVIASVDRVIAAAREPAAPLRAMVSPQTRIVTLTVTEKAYGIDRTSMAIDPDHPSIAPDLSDPRHPRGAIGLLVESLRLRRDRGVAPFTVLCCDNLPENGHLLRAGVQDFARRIDPDLADWMEAEVCFPSSMVDRITPAATPQTQDEALRLTGCLDLAAIETEPFSQWVIEDRFCNGRPAWEAGGALFVKDVKPYEMMKLRMLNGAHSMLAYCGFIAGCKHVRDAMAHPHLAALVDRHIAAAGSTLPDLAGLDLDSYRRDLISRFCNPAIAHDTYQIAMDGTQKLPQRICAPAAETLSRGGDTRPFAFAVAAWMRYCIGKTDAGTDYPLRDPRQSEIQTALGNASSPAGICAALSQLPGLFPASLADNDSWQDQLTGFLTEMLQHGMDHTLAAAASDLTQVN